MRIKWIDAQKELKKILKKKVQIHASTEVPQDFKACVVGEVRKGGRVDILLNLLYAKTKEEIIEELAHEAAHVLALDETHSVKWLQAKEKIRKRLEKVV